MSSNRISRYLDGKSPRRGYDGKSYISRKAMDDPGFVSRLSTKIHENDAELRANLANIIENDVSPEVSFFPDSNLWDIKVESNLWDALLARPESIYVIPNVRLEVNDWVMRNPSYIGSRAIIEGHPNLFVTSLPGQGTPEANAYLYYVYLLQTRRRIFEIMKYEFRRKERRDPSNDELMAAVQRKFGERGLVLAHKDGRHVPFDRRATDESLVYFAFEHALRTGRPTIILTKDEDVLEQFYKLWWLLDTHYRAVLMADHFFRYRFDFPLHPFPRVRHAKEFFFLENATLVEFGNTRMNMFLPARPNFVAVECWLLRPKMSMTVAGAETQMYRVLQVKGETGGLVSGELGGRNLHPWLVPLPLKDRLATCAAVVKDRTITLTDSMVKVGTFDLTHAVNTNERFSKIAADPNNSEAGLWTPKSTHRQPRVTDQQVLEHDLLSRSKMGLWLPRK